MSLDTSDNTPEHTIRFCTGPVCKQRVQELHGETTVFQQLAEMGDIQNPGRTEQIHINDTRVCIQQIACLKQCGRGPLGVHCANDSRQSVKIDSIEAALALLEKGSQ